MKARATVIMYLRSLIWTINGDDHLHAPVALIPEKGPSYEHFYEFGFSFCSGLDAVNRTISCPLKGIEH
jgi:hypothetical protein